jgi:hypothetical protein
MDVQKITEDIMINAINRYSKEYNVDSIKTQLMIKASDEECNPSYQLLINNRFERDLTFNQILNVKLDFLGREIIASPFIASALRRLRREHPCNYKELNILIYKKQEENKNPSLYFFEGTKAVKPIGMDYIFNDILN